MNERTDNNAKTTAVPSDSAPVRAFVETEVFERARRGGEAPAGTAGPLPGRTERPTGANGSPKQRREESPAAARGQLPAGFPWLLVIQIVLAIISYLIRRTPALAASDRSYLFDLKHKLEAGFPEVRAD